jgi:hypothetical protein
MFALVLAGCSLRPPVGSSTDRRPDARPAPVARFYHTDLRFPSATELEAARAGSLVVVTFKVPAGWVASGGADDRLRADAARMSGAGGDWLVGFWHEPEDDLTPDAYRAAARRVADVMGMPNVRTISVLMASTFASGEAATWYPGDDAVDVIGVDGYDWRGCRGHGGVADPASAARSFGAIFEPADRFATEHGKPLLVAEFGTPRDPAEPDGQVAWLHAAGRWLDAHPEVIGTWYFDLGLSSGFRCDWELDAAARAADAALSRPAAPGPMTPGGPALGPSPAGGSP